MLDQSSPSGCPLLVVGGQHALLFLEIQHQLPRSAVFDKVRDILGLYLTRPPAPWLCVWTRRARSLRTTAAHSPRQPERRTHEYIRYGAAGLFAAFEVASGRVLGQLHRRHRAREFHRFLHTIERNVSTELDPHLTRDNDGTHKTQLIRRGLAKRAHNSTCTSLPPRLRG